MTTLQAKQINAYMMLNSAFWHAFRDASAAIVIIDARMEVSLEMDSETLLTAITLCGELEDMRRVA
jgi:hypothetical protein